jgi:hypothetical protein
MAKRGVNELSVCGLGLFGGVVRHSSTGQNYPKWKNKEGLGRSSATYPLPFLIAETPAHMMPLPRRTFVSLYYRVQR